MGGSLVGRIRSIGAVRTLESRVRESLRDDQVYRSLGEIEAAVERQDAMRRRLVEAGESLERTVMSRLAVLDEFAVRIQSLEARLSDLETNVAQITSTLRREGDIPLPPPKHLQVRVVGHYVPAFVSSGDAICDDFESVLKTAGKSLGDFPRILDWGCGCGRVTAALRKRLPGCQLSGSDIDPEAIEWLRQNYGRFADFRLAPHSPPMPFEDSAFDLVLGLSVFTHLPEDMQFEWLDELKRVTAPGGYLILTTSGEMNYRNLDPESQDVMRTKGFLYTDPSVFNYGRSVSLPDFYQNTFHSVAYIRDRWSKYFEIIDILPGRIQNHQDAVLVRNRK